MIFERKNPPTSAHAISELERKLLIHLPDDYRKFLLVYNGGYLDRENDYFFQTGDGNSFAVEDFLGITDELQTSLETERFTNFSNGIRKKLLRIGYATGATLFLDLRKGSYGKIYLRTHGSLANDLTPIDDTGFEDETDYAEARFLHPVANSWTEFVAMLGPEPPFDD